MSPRPRCELQCLGSRCRVAVAHVKVVIHPSCCECTLARCKTCANLQIHWKQRALAKPLGLRMYSWGRTILQGLDPHSSDSVEDRWTLSRSTHEGPGEATTPHSSISYDPCQEGNGYPQSLQGKPIMRNNAYMYIPDRSRSPSRHGGFADVGTYL